MVVGVNIKIGKVGIKCIYENVPIETVLAELDLLLERFGLSSEEVEIFIKPKFLPRFLWEILLPVQTFKF